jgi:phosphoglucomutase
MYKEKYLAWKNHPNLDPKLREELETLSESQIEDAFYTDCRFQTAGMRGLLGVGTNRLNIHTVRKATYGYARYLVDTCSEPKVAISYDNRHMSREFALDCAKILAGFGIRVYVAKVLKPTPELSFMVRYYHCDGGIMITASHNPKEYNGYKIYDREGCQLIPKLADKVIAYIDQIDDPLSITVKDYDESLIELVDKDIDEAYYAEVLKIRLRKDLDKDFKIVFSSEHGTSYEAVKETMKRAGYDLHPLMEQCVPDPDFSKTASPNPEVDSAYDGVMKLAREIGAELILITDPDGDRMGVAVKQDEDYVILNGNQTGAILLEYICMTRKEQGTLPANGCMFNTVVTSEFGNAVARKYGVDVEQTLTGFKYIGDKYHKYEENHEKEYVFGYEESYGSLISPFVRDKDAVQACLMLAEACAYYRQFNKTLYDVIKEDYEQLGYYLDSQSSILLPGAQGEARLKQLMKSFRESPLKTLAGYKVVKVEDYLLAQSQENGTVSPLEGFDRSDVLKYYLADGSYLAIRPSGTEPKCKFYYCIKANDHEQALDKKRDFQKDIDEIIGN